MTSAHTQPGALFIIGAGPGIGKATAERFGREGWKIVAASRSPKNLDPLVASLVGQNIDAHGMVLDATDPLAVSASMRNADRLTGGLTAVLYNAALVREQDLFSMSDADITSDLAINIAGAMYAIRSAVQVFGARGGTILLTGGGLAITPHASYASLGAGKAALRNLVHGLAPSLAAHNIRIATATIGTLVAPDSPEASGAAETLWTLATQPGAPWELSFPRAD
jgi:NAD(P)-dependent dehydrogenase (short-subunit alcohol dehydrogenase family)